MMKWPRKKQAPEEAIDEHNQPTEPMPRFVLPAYTPPTVQANQPFAEPTIATTPETPLSPQQQIPIIPGVPQPPYNPYPNNPGLASGLPPAAPALPPLPQDVQAQQKGKENTKRSRFRRPLYIGFFFVVVQFLLLARFIMNMLNLPIDNVWRDIVFTFSDVFLLPFTLLFRQFALPANVGPELYTLLAVLVYGIISRMLVRLLKALSRTQQAQTPS